MGVSTSFNCTSFLLNELALSLKYFIPFFLIKKHAILIYFTWLMFINTFFNGVCFTSCRSFVNNVWYIKILSPEDIQKMGEQAVESLALGSGQRLNGTGAESQDIVSGPPSIGSLEY